MKASVVINTYNRASYLGNAVRSIATQSFADVELVIVNGPSTDDTVPVLEQLGSQGYQFKLLDCASRNLSESRNIGIAACAGDVVFFIDDDGVAHRQWVERLMRAYADSQVGAAGGFTLDHTGMDFQCRYTVCDRLGNASFLSTLDPAQLLSTGGGFAYPSLLGTNCSFRKSELLRIGGFDEVFAYMLDETDVCLRIFDRGHKIVTVPDAYVLHKYAPSHTRNAQRIPASLLAPARSKSYFMLKHANRNNGNLADIYGLIDGYRRDIDFSNRWFLDHKKITVAHYAKLSKELTDGINEGLTLGADEAVMNRASAHLSRPQALADSFLPVLRGGPLHPANQALRIYLVSQGYPPADTSGIARWTHECARGLADLGHEVHVITRSASEGAFVDMVGGVWLHSVPDRFDDERVYLSPVPLPDSILRRAEAVLAEIKRCQGIWGVDVVSAPIWDLEGILCAEYLELPVITSLHTTYRLALPFKPAWTTDREYRRRHVNLVMAGERWLLSHGASILANSQEIVHEIDAAYQCSLATQAKQLAVVPHGLDAAPAAPELGAPRAPGPLRILFVGRLEERKGPDTLLAALALLPRNTPPLAIELLGQSPGDKDEFVRALKAAAAKLSARPAQFTVNFVGYVDDATLQQAYARCDIFVAPSRFESFGLILIEAMRWAKPVVACDIGGMREVIDSGDSGLLVPPGDADALAASLRTLINDSELRHGLGQRGFERYLQRFTRQTMALQLQAFLASVSTQGATA